MIVWSISQPFFLYIGLELEGVNLRLVSRSVKRILGNSLIVLLIVHLCSSILWIWLCSTLIYCLWLCSTCLCSRGSWETWLPLAEFSHNNSYQESIKMALFEALYGQKCRTRLNWIEPSERRYYDINFVIDAEKKVQIIQQHMRAAQSRQKSYADKRRRPLKFNVGYYVYLKVTPMKKVQRF